MIDSSRKKPQRDTEKAERKKRCPLTQKDAFFVPYSPISGFCRHYVRCNFRCYQPFSKKVLVKRSGFLWMKMVPLNFWWCIRTRLSILSLIYHVFPLLSSLLSDVSWNNHVQISPILLSSENPLLTCFGSSWRYVEPFRRLRLQNPVP